MHNEHHGRTAFLLNSNAKRVSDSLVEQLINEIDAGDLYYSNSKEAAENYLHAIVRKGYQSVFVGGGDGTAMHAINTLSNLHRSEPHLHQPYLGILKLGTGNALAHHLGAGHPIGDVRYLLRHPAEPMGQPYMVQCEEQGLSPFAGIGYDGEVLNDYRSLCKRYENAPFKNLRESVVGYAWAGFTKFIPRHLIGQQPIIRIRTLQKAYHIIHQAGQDTEIEIPEGEIIFEGNAATVSVGTIPFWGYGFTMFPFATQKKGFMQLRITACSIFTLLQNLYPSVWNGKFRHPNLHDFLVKDICVESSEALPYQVGGDPAGHKSSLRFQVAQLPFSMCRYPKQNRSTSPKIKQIFQLPALIRGQ